MKTYEPELLVSGSPENMSWGVAWYRFLAGDKPVNEVYPQYSLEDEEIEGLLRVTSKMSANVRYYMPHEALIYKVLSDPTYAVQVSEESYSQTFVNPHQLAQNVRMLAAKHLTNLYPTDISLTSSVSLNPRF